MDGGLIFLFFKLFEEHVPPPPQLRNFEYASKNAIWNSW